MRRCHPPTLPTLLLGLLLVLACGGGDGGYDPFEPDTDDPGGDTQPPPQDTSSSASEKPDSLPWFSSLALYSASSPWNQAIGADPEVDPGSATMISKFTASGELSISVRRWSSPIFFADASTPRVSVSLPCGTEWGMGVSRLDNVPIPTFAEPANDIDGETVTGCGDGDPDNHMVILDLVNRCEYDFWQARKVGGAWSASWGNSISLDDDGIYDAGMSTRGSGFAFPGGLVWPDELAKGEITHALGFNYPFTRSGGPVAPATDTDGITDGSDAIPEGALLQLDPSFDTSGLSGFELTIAKALQTYGMYLVDTGGDEGIGLYAVDPRSVSGNPYEGLLPAEDWPLLPNIPLDRFRVLKMGAQDPDFQDKLDLVASGCGQFN